jgi:hypothetical protein
MADKRGLEVVGVAFGLLTAMVIMIGALVVKGHLDGRLTLDSRQVVPVQTVSTQVASTQVVSPAASIVR